MHFSTIRAAIVSRLSSIVPASLGQVMNGEQFQNLNEIGSWPAAEVVRVGAEPDYLTNREDLLTYVFEVRLYQQVPAENTASVEVSMDATVDAVIAAFMGDVNLGGVIEPRIRPVSVSNSVITWQGQQVRQDTIILRCPKIVDLTG